MPSQTPTGGTWRDLPVHYGPYTTCHKLFVRWRCAGIWDRILAAGSHYDGADVEIADSTVVRAHQHVTCTNMALSKGLAGRAEG